MKKWASLAKNVFAVIGLILLLSKLLSCLFGEQSQRAWLLTHPAGMLVYLLVLPLAAGLCVYGYHRLFGEDDAEPGEKEYPEPTEEDIAAVRRLCSRPAVVLRSTAVTELPEGYVSCLGRVAWQLPGEEWPTDADGKRLEPLATLFVPDLPAVPEPLRKLALITIYAPYEEYIAPEEDPQMGFVIRTYASLEGLQPCNAVSEQWKTCLLTPVPVTHDMPTFLDEDSVYWADIEWFPNKYGDEGYEKYVCNAAYTAHGSCASPKVSADDLANPDVYAVCETHKFGGNPTYCQGTPDVENDYPFVLQINSDDNADLNIGDAGSYYLYYSAEKNAWRVEMDCY